MEETKLVNMSRISRHFRPGTAVDLRYITAITTRPDKDTDGDPHPSDVQIVIWCGENIVAETNTVNLREWDAEVIVGNVLTAKEHEHRFQRWTVEDGVVVPA